MSEFNLMDFRDRFPIKPYDLVWHEGATWEAISFPWPETVVWKPGDGAGINIRKQGDPTTMIAVDATTMEVVGPVVEGNTVVCRDCSRKYMLCPADDYFGATHDHDGRCEECLLKSKNISRMLVVNPELGASLQREFERRAREK